jgi:hypothetical protein
MELNLVPEEPINAGQRRRDEPAGWLSSAQSWLHSPDLSKPLGRTAPEVDGALCFRKRLQEFQGTKKRGEERRVVDKDLAGTIPDSVSYLVWHRPYSAGLQGLFPEVVRSVTDSA